MEITIKASAKRKGFDKAIKEAIKTDAEKGRTSNGFAFIKKLNSLILL